ncbi:uncharacterized protein LOC131891405 [Tigriopus californicus]|uniref:uncharacterized protein LOC131891405 n=1 Tax=Tigriopus californicus TaxID=6832 RepID=UPI0027D9D3BC|nr:uncharacterized protein LOC131891405 [Tigriopus californicus]
MFKEARLIENGTVLNPQCDNCLFVTYLSSSLSYGNDAKKSQKCMEAYHQDDLLGVVQSNDINNADFMERRQQFLTKSLPQTYKAYPSIFMGQLQTGIFFNEEGMLPDGCDVTIVFTQTTNEFRAFTSDETDDIVVTLVSLKLHVKISALMIRLCTN